MHRSSLDRFRPEMPLFRNLCVNLRVSLCDVLEYVSAQTLDFLDLTKNRLFPHRKLRRFHTGLFGWKLANDRKMRFLTIINRKSGIGKYSTGEQGTPEKCGLNFRGRTGSAEYRPAPNLNSRT